MKIFSKSRLFALLLAPVLLCSCASTDFQSLESTAPITAQGKEGLRKVVDGVDIWTFGAPPRKYRVLGVINDRRGAGILPMAGYYRGIAAKVRQYGGNAAIEVGSSRQYIGTTAFANATATGYNYGNFSTSNISASGTSVPLFRHLGTFLVVKYL